MSLVAWYPLKGDLNDYSGKSNHLQSTDSINITVSSGGKIGRCYNFTGTGYLRSTRPFDLGNSVTYCAWVYNDSTSTSNYHGIVNNFSHSGSTGYNSGLSISKAGSIRLDIPIRDGSSHIAIESSAIVPDNKWVHISATINYTTGRVCLFMSGEIVHDSSFASKYLPIKTATKEIMIGQWGWSYASAYSFKGRINDVRVYDEALSVREIKEISLGRVLHYDCNMISTAVKNLAPRQDNIYNKIPGNVSPGWDKTKHTQAIQLSGWSIGYNGGVSSPNLGYHAHFIFDIDGTTPVLKLPNLNNSDGLTLGYRWLGMSASMGTGLFRAGKKYTISWDQKVSEINQGTELGIYHQLNGQSSSGFHNGSKSPYCKNTRINTWEKLSYTFTLSSTFDESSTPSIYIYGNINSGQGISYVKNIQIEAGEHYGQFVNGESLPVIPDSSGYNHHSNPLTLTTTPSWVEDTAIGSGGYKFNGTNNIVHPNPFIGQDNLQQEWTVSAFIKIDPSCGACKINDFNSGNHIRSSSNKTLLYLNSGSNDYYRYGQMLPTNEFIHIAFVFRNSDEYMRIYKNGVAIHDSGQTTSTKKPLGIKNSVTLLDTFKGILSNYSIYATALSESDILNISQTRAHVSNTGTLLINDVVESANLFDPLVILDRQREIGVNSSSKIIMKDNCRAMALSAASFYKNSTRYSIFPAGYFKTNTSYIFDLLINSNLIHNGTEVTGGIEIVYTDGSRASNFVVKTSGRWKRYVLETATNKTIKDVEVHYYIGELFYINTWASSIRENFNPYINEKGQLITPSIRQVGRPVRYIRDHLNGSTANAGNHWVEINALSGGANVLKGIIPTASSGTLTNGQLLTDGSTATSPYASCDGGAKYIQFDIGHIAMVDIIGVWHYHGDTRTYHGTKTEISVDGTNWIPVYNSAVDGAYVESANGNQILLTNDIFSFDDLANTNISSLTQI